MKSGAKDKMPRRVTLLLKTLGENFQIARKKRGMTVRATAEAANVSIDTYRRLEKGDPGVSLGVFSMALLALGEQRRLEGFLDIATDDVGLLKDIAKLPLRVRSRKGGPEGL